MCTAPLYCSSVLYVQLHSTAHLYSMYRLTGVLTPPTLHPATDSAAGKAQGPSKLASRPALLLPSVPSVALSALPSTLLEEADCRGALAGCPARFAVPAAVAP